MSTGERGNKGGGHVGSLFLATVLGVGVGLLAAPQPGADTRRALRQRMAALGDDFGEELEELEERGGRARKAVRKRAAQLKRRGRKRYEEAIESLADVDEGDDELEDESEEDEDADEGSSALPTVLAVAAGLAAAAYLLTSERAAPTRERMREAAATVKDEAEARWDNFQRRRENGHADRESDTRMDAPGSAPQAS
ncbi:MAG TPA: YtxH domain-containing protein [Gemmatimonadales bacterium]|jgi:gas vesicle protein|nr:YtxH domain-containing protein [Gemmatimonadales bacterium]